MPDTNGQTEVALKAAYSIEQSDEQVKGTSAAIRYRLSFPNASQHLLSITMEIDTDQPEIVLAMPNWIPGSYKVRDFMAGQISP